MQAVTHRWFGVGHSTAADSAKAGAEATGEALAGRTPQAVLVLCSTGHDGNALLDAVRAEAGRQTGLLTFDCGSRRGILGQDGAQDEAQAVRAVVGDVPFGGFHTMGEIARVRGSSGTHALTLATLALA